MVMESAKSVSKAPLEEEAKGQCDHEGISQAIPTTVIKLNNFTQWSASGCVLPYLSVYFLHYTQATPSDVGLFMLLSAIAGIFVSFLFSSLADRYQAHRLVYLASLLMSYANYLVMLVPILLTPNESAQDYDIAQESAASNLTSVSEGAQQMTTTVQTIDQHNVAWFYVIGICVAIGNMGSSVNMNISDSFSANAARSAQQSSISGTSSSGPSFGSLRFFGSIGWCLASFSLSLMNSFEPAMPYLLASWLLWLLLATINILLILFWPDTRPFDLARDEQQPADGSELQIKLDEEDKVEHQELFTWAFTGRRKRWWHLNAFKRHQNAANSFLDPSQFEHGNRDVRLTGGRMYDFDSLEMMEGNAFGSNERHRQTNVRRCSIAPLGNSYICEQFVIVDDARQSSTMTCNGHSTCEEQQHFKYIAKIEPINVGKLNELAIMKQVAEQQVVHNSKAKSELRQQAKEGEKISFKLYLKIIELIARRNGNMPRFMLLYIVLGFIISMNWVYLFPYLEHLDEFKFRTLGAWVMISSYFSETLFYYVSGRLTSKLSSANGLSLVLLMFALRYLLYLSFALWPQASWWPLELIVVVELMQSVSQGWFECIFNESALEFALEAERCVPQLISLQLIPNTPAAIEQVRNSVKLTLFSVSSGCFDGLGVGFGALVGGWLIGRHGFTTLWLTCALLALAVCFLNVLLEFLLATTSRRRKGTQLNKTLAEELEGKTNKVQIGSGC